MGQASGALNARGFTESVNNGYLPGQDHITHSGLINENYFKISSKATKLQQLQIGNAISNCDLYDLDNRNYFISLFMKSSTDGEQRTRSFNVVIALDISGSMGSALKRAINPAQNVSRLQLAKRAIIKLIEKLKPQDAFSLVVFHNTARTVIPSQFINDANLQQLKGLVNSKFESGGTTIASGFNESMKNINAFKQKNTLKNYENRIIMLTDVGDNSIEGQQKLISNISTAGVSTTIIGISSQFKSNTCEKLIKVKGFNYMCAVQDQDLQTYLVDQFDYTFFPCVQKVNIKLQSQDITAIKVFGSVDHDVSYPVEGNTFTVTKMESGFPSALQQNKEGIYQMKGGLILIKYTPKTSIQLSSLKIKVKLTYQDNEGSPFSEDYIIDNDISAQEYYSNESIKKGVTLFYYAQTMRNLLKDMNGKLSDLNKEFYLGKLKKLEQYCPQQKIEQLKKIMKIVEPK